jgi:hypothetical protein
MPAGVSQHHAQPGGLRAQRGGEQVIGGAEMLGAQDQAVDVPLPEPDRACPIQYQVANGQCVDLWVVR